MRKNVAKMKKIKNYICLTIPIFIVAGILVFHLKMILIKLKDNYLSFQIRQIKVFLNSVSWRFFHLFINSPVIYFKINFRRSIPLTVQF
jgi:hypothetical protein